MILTLMRTYIQWCAVNANKPPSLGVARKIDLVQNDGTKRLNFQFVQLLDVTKARDWSGIKTSAKKQPENNHDTGDTDFQFY